MMLATWGFLVPGVLLDAPEQTGHFGDRFQIELWCTCSLLWFSAHFPSSSASAQHLSLQAH